MEIYIQSGFLLLGLVHGEDAQATVGRILM